MACSPHDVSPETRFRTMLDKCMSQCLTDVSCVFRLIEDGCVTFTAVVHVEDVFAVGQKEKCDR